MKSVDGRRPPKRTYLREYVGIGMAAMLMGRSMEQTGVVYDVINEFGIPVYKIGGVSLISYQDLVVCAGERLGDSPEPPWPDELGNLLVDNIFSRTELADLLNVSVGTIHRRAADGEIQALDLSEWNMHSMYYYDGSATKQLPVELNMGGRRIKVSLQGKELHIDIWMDDPAHAVCFDPEPNKAWFIERYTNNTNVLVEVHDKE